MDSGPFSHGILPLFELGTQQACLDRLEVGLEAARGWPSLLPRRPPEMSLSRLGERVGPAERGCELCWCQVEFSPVSQ